jgi:hypothetical protein
VTQRDGASIDVTDGLWYTQQLQVGQYDHSERLPVINKQQTSEEWKSKAQEQEQGVD